MFGHQDDKDEDNTATPQDTHANPVAPHELAGGPAEQTTAPHVAETGTKPAADGDDAWQHPGVPLDDSTGSEPVAPITDVVVPAGGGKSSFQLHTSGGGGHTFSDDSSDHDDTTENTPHELIDIKQKALGQLTPLIDKLDQTPEDKFRTTMMMIQASDDQSLVKLAYDSANDIKDEKVRAQALLDIVNEINYFTQHPDN